MSIGCFCTLAAQIQSVFLRTQFLPSASADNPYLDLDYSAKSLPSLSNVNIQAKSYFALFKFSLFSL